MLLLISSVALPGEVGGSARGARLEMGNQALWGYQRIYLWS